MPSRNSVKIYVPNSFYHVYNRGVNKRNLFKDQRDYAVFLNLMKRHLGKEEVKDNRGRAYTNFSKEVELLAYCLMPNHFHLLLYQKSTQGMTKLMRRIMTAYSTYFNKQYDRVGHLFQGSYKAVRINNEAYLWHISRYIHLNPLDIRQEWQTYKYSSYPYYSSQKQADWVRPNRILDIHQEHQQEYAKFVSDYQNYKKTLHVIKSELAY